MEVFDLLRYQVWVLLIQSCTFLANHADGATLSDTPMNVASVAGLNVTMPCKCDDSLQTVTWYYLGQLIYNGVQPTNATKYAIVKNEPGRFDLVLLNTALEGFGGDYKCQLYVDSSIYFVAQFIVLADNPLLTNNVTAGGALQGEVVMVRCYVTYQGVWGPVSTLTKNSLFVNAVNESRVGSPSVSQYSFYFTALPSDNGAVFACQTLFNAVTVSDPSHSASNTPSYTYTSSLQPIIVWYPPQNVAVNPAPINGNSYYPGQLATCSASGNPAPAYYWLVQTFNSTMNISGATLTLTSTMTGNVTAVCMSSNIIRSSLYTVSSLSYNFIVLAPTTTTTTTTVAPTVTESTTLDGGASSGGNNNGLNAGAIAGIVIACIVVAAIVIFFIVFCCFCRNSTPKAKPQAQQYSAQQARSAPNDSMRPPIGYHNGGGPDYDSNNYPPPIYSPPSDVSYQKNPEGITYAELAFDDQPRSRKPVQYLPSASSTSELNLSNARY